MLGEGRKTERNAEVMRGQEAEQLCCAWSRAAGRWGGGTSQMQGEVTLWSRRRA